MRIDGRSGLSNQFTALMAKAGIDQRQVQSSKNRKFSRLSFHSLRHSFSSALANAGISADVRMKLTGHRTVAAHQRYTHVELKPLRQAIAALPTLRVNRLEKKKEPITNEPLPDQAEEFEFNARILNKYPPSRPLPAHFFNGPSESGAETSNQVTFTRWRRARVRSKRSSASSDKERSEWFFSQLEASEIEVCRAYEMGREAVALERLYKQQPESKQFGDSQWLELRVMMIRRAWQLTGFASSVKENPTWFMFPASRVLVLYPEWPDQAYLEIDRWERLRRLQVLSTAATKDERLASLANVLEPSNPSTGKKWICEIAIPLSSTHEDLREAFAAWLKIYCPRQGKIGRSKHEKTDYSKSLGRGSEKATAADDLNALAAYRLCKVAGLPRTKVIELVRHPQTGKNPGARVYTSEKQLHKPLNRILHRMQAFRNQVIGDLQPLEPMNLSQPDFTLL
jgi:hypothetical protein